MPKKPKKAKQFGHIQVPFTRANGYPCEVDEGLLDILVALRDHGVRTQYSCQGDEETLAYILADTKSFKPVLNKILRLYKEGRLSVKSSYLVSRALHGYRQIELLIFLGRRTGTTFRNSIHRGYHDRDGYSLERSYSIRHGDRITIRFPSNKRADFLSLLNEISELN